MNYIHTKFDPFGDDVDRGYFVYVNVADIMDPPYPQNTTDKWHHTGTSPSVLMEVMTKLRVMMQCIREKEGDSQLSYGYWLDYWTKYDKAHKFLDSHGWTRVYKTFYGRDRIRVIDRGKYYEPESGMHRIWLAKRMDFEKLPVQVQKP